MFAARSLLLVPALALAACATPRATEASRSTTPEADEQTVVATADPQKTLVTAPREEEVCTYERVTGSNLPRRVCRTQRVADKEREQADEAITRMRLAPRPSEF